MVTYAVRERNEIPKHIESLSPIQKQLLSSRLKLEEYKDFCNTKDCLEPFMKDPKLITGAKLLKHHIDKGSSILLITDGDCDGISCAAIGNLFFKHETGRTPVPYVNPNTDDSTLLYGRGENVRPMQKGELYIIVNDRIYGNGVNLGHARTILKYKPDLIITADHGSSDKESFALIRDILPVTDILITDHHIVPDGEPPVHDAFINPHDEGSKLGQALCGASVLYLLFKAYANKELKYLYPILGLATIVDQMSLNIPYNRFFYNMANKHLKNFKPFRYYISYAEHRYLWSTEFYSIGMGPLINSTKRMNMPDVGYKFLTSTNEDDLRIYFNKMLGSNKKRKKQQQSVELSIQDSLHIDRRNYENSRIAITNIKNGVNGILASRLVDDDHVPAFVFNSAGNTYEGSGRGYGDFDIEGLISNFRNANKNVYISGGGHKGAGGLRLRKEGLYLFRDMFDRMAKKSDGSIKEYFDGEFPLALLNKPETRKLLRGLQPFGRDFPYPVYRVKCSVKGFRNYGPSFYIYDVYDSNNIHYEMMRFSKINVEYNTPVSLYVSPRGKKDFILLN